MQDLGCNRMLLNRIKTFRNVPRAAGARIHSPITTATIRRSFVASAALRAVLRFFATTTCSGQELRYYPAGRFRECTANSNGATYTCLFRKLEG